MNKANGRPRVRRSGKQRFCFLEGESPSKTRLFAHGARAWHHRRVLHACRYLMCISHDIMYLLCQHPELDSNRHQKQTADAPPAASVALSVRLAGVPRAVALHLPHGAAAARHGAHARGVATQRNRRAAREALAVVPLRRRCVPPPSRARAASLSPRSSRATAPRRSVTACTARAVPDDARAGSPCVEPHAPVTRAHGWPVHGAAPLRHCAPAFGYMPIRLRCRCGREGIR